MNQTDSEENLQRPAAPQAPAFTKRIRGYDAAQVNAYIEEALEVIRSLTTENNCLKSEIERWRNGARTSRLQEARIAKMLDKMEATSASIIEQARTNAAAIASQTEHERLLLKKNARDEAALIIRDAERRAQNILEDAHRARAAVLEEVGMLRARRATIIARIKAVLSSQLEFLKSLEREGNVPDPDSVPAPARSLTREGIGADELTSILAALDETAREDND